MEYLEEFFTRHENEKHNIWFERIAKELFARYIIRTKTAAYRLKEIEFYYHSKDHPDNTTYGYFNDRPKSDRIYRHKLAQTYIFTWFFHYSGVDLVFGSEGIPGGILIRSIQCIERDGKKINEEIKGPLVVLLELLNQRMKLDGTDPIELILVKSKLFFDVSLLKRNKRVGLDKADPSNKEYNFSVQ